MATVFSIHLPAEVSAARASACAVLDEVDRLESMLTIFNDQSDMTQMNRQAATEAVRVPGELFEVLELASQISAKTAGAFDVTAGALIKAWGFHGRAPAAPATERLEAALARVGMEHVRLDPLTQTVRFDRAGIEINLGSIGKGFALDRGAAILRDVGVETALLDAGRSSVRTIGAPAPFEAGWPIGIADPHRAGSRIARVYLQDRALATSAATYQHLLYQGKALGHIVDPRSGWPADGMASATAIAPTAAEADALSTAFYVMGVEAVREFCMANHGMAAIIVPTAGYPRSFGLKPTEIEWHVPGFAA